MEAEQATLDKHDDDVTTVTVRLETLSTSADHARAAVIPDPRKTLSRRLSRVQAGLKRVRDIVAAADGPVEPSVLMQCQEEATDFKRDLAALYDELVSKDVPEDDELSVAHSALEVELSDIASKVKGLLAAAPSETSPRHSASDSSGIKLPRLDVPIFDGNIIHWKQFWEQFSVSVHDRTNLSNAEKIVYPTCPQGWISEKCN